MTHFVLFVNSKRIEKVHQTKKEFWDVNRDSLWIAAINNTDRVSFSQFSTLCTDFGQNKECDQKRH